MQETKAFRKANKPVQFTITGRDFNGLEKSITFLYIAHPVAGGAKRPAAHEIIRRVVQ